MAQISQSALHNRLLRALPADDFARLQPHLRHVEVKRGHVIIEPNEAIEQVHFPEQGIASIVTTTPGEGRRLEVGLYGREGTSGTSVVLGTDRIPHETSTRSPVRRSSWERMSSPRRAGGAPP